MNPIQNRLFHIKHLPDRFGGPRAWNQLSRVLGTQTVFSEQMLHAGSFLRMLPIQTHPLFSKKQSTNEKCLKKQLDLTDPDIIKDGPK